jgi:hypothetical protein
MILMLNPSVIFILIRWNRFLLTRLIFPDRSRVVRLLARVRSLLGVCGVCHCVSVSPALPPFPLSRPPRSSRLSSCLASPRGENPPFSLHQLLHAEEARRRQRRTRREQRAETRGRVEMNILSSPRPRSYILHWCWW